jgi:hypothetical protein
MENKILKYLQGKNQKAVFTPISNLMVLMGEIESKRK